MAETAWPDANRRNYIGNYVSRLDGPWKACGTAKYAYDVNREDLLYAKCLQATIANGKVTAIDTSEAEAMRGVVAVLVERNPRSGELPEIGYAGDIVATVAAETEEIVNEALRKIKVTYEESAPEMDDNDPAKASGRDQERTEGDPDAGFQEADKIVEGKYGMECITHCCLEPHGQACEFKDGDLYVWPSTQSVSGYAGGLRNAADLPQERIHVDCQVMGGGFGAKFGADRWGEIAVELSKSTGRPVKLMLERDMELKVAGHRPSAFAEVKMGVKNDGTITAMDAVCWGSSGVQRWRIPPLPYVFERIPNYRWVGKGILTNRGAVRAWRAPNHPQGCFITMAALEDAAAAIGMDALEFFKKNLHLTARPDVYAEEFDIAAEMINYSAKAHPRGDTTEGPIKRGLGLSIHTWGGRGHPSACTVTVNPDGSVRSQIGTQDLGTGTRTTIAMVVADTLGIPLDKVHSEIGKNSFPNSGASGGSTTIGGVSSSSRDAATQALNAILEKAAPELDVAADKLEAWNGRIQEIGNPSNSMSWDEACSLIGQMSITKQGSNPTSDGTVLTTDGAGGVQIADVSVDIETGVVTMNEFVAVQDVGLVIDMKTAESQVFGAMIMGITYSLYEETVFDPATGAMLNPDMEFYRLAGLGDIGKLKVHMMTGPKYDAQGVIGLGEPPVISPGAAISNAIANATGVRCPDAPFTPDRVLKALEEGGVLS